MLLAEYLKAHSLSLSEFARRIGAKNARTVQRWTVHGEMPSTQAIAKVKEATGGAVQPNDWFQ